MQARPPRRLLSSSSTRLRGERPGHGRDERRIEPAREQHAVGHVAHQLAVHGGLERRAQLAGIERLARTATSTSRQARS